METMSLLTISRSNKKVRKFDRLIRLFSSVLKIWSLHCMYFVFLVVHYLINLYFVGPNLFKI